MLIFVFSYFRGAWWMTINKWRYILHFTSFSRFFLFFCVLFMQFGFILQTFSFKYLQKSHHKQSVKLLMVCTRNENFENLFCFLCASFRTMIWAHRCARGYYYFCLLGTHYLYGYLSAIKIPMTFANHIGRHFFHFSQCWI